MVWDRKKKRNQVTKFLPECEAFPKIQNAYQNVKKLLFCEMQSQKGNSQALALRLINQGKEKLNG